MLVAICCSCALVGAFEPDVPWLCCSPLAIALTSDCCDTP